ncbi:MAG TPA: hypothetical protein VHE12_07715 [bacterium]|nr:hypothetical protein [bacterium]
MNRTREGNWGPWALLGLVLVFYGRVLWGHQTFVFVDASRFFYPLWKWGSGVLAQGFIPLWNPDAQFGTPYLADPQMACAYPPIFLLYSFLSPVNAFNALVILHHFWALWGFWAFVRRQGFSAPASLLGSFLFGFSLHLVCSSWTPVALMTISWIPWVFLSADKVFRGERGGFLALSLAWAMQFAAGYPVLVYLTALAVGAHFVWMGLAQGTKTPSPLREEGKGDRDHFFPWHSFLPGKGKGGTSLYKKWNWTLVLAGAGLLAVAYNLVWGLPFLEMTGLSNYENGAIRYHDLGWWDLATLLNPFDQGHPLLSNYHGPHYWVSTFFVGLPALGLLAWGFWRRAFARTSWGLLLVFLVLSLGVLKVGHLLGKIIPGLNMVVHSGFWLSLFVFWVAWMAAESAEALVGGPASRSGRHLWAGLLAALGLAALVIAPVLMPVPWALSLAAGFALFFLKGPRVRWWALGTSVFLALFIPAQSLNILLDRDYYEEPPKTLSALTEPGRAFFTPPLLARSIHLQGADMKDAYDGAKRNVYPNWPLAYGREEAPIYNTLQLRHSADWTFQALRVSKKVSRNVLDYLGIRYLFGKADLPGLKKIEGTGDVAVYRVEKSSRKWFSVRKALPAGDSLEEDLKKVDERGLDLTQDCFVADKPREGNYAVREVVRTAWGPDAVGLEAKGKGRAFLVSSETAYPGWKVSVNGKERSLELVDHAFRGLVLEDGETTAQLTFKPNSFRVGLFMTLLVLGSWIFLFGRKWFHER